MKNHPTADFHFENFHSLWLVEPLTAAAREHLQKHLDNEALWFGGAVAVEPRYVADFAWALLSSGFEVR